MKVIITIMKNGYLIEENERMTKHGIVFFSENESDKLLEHIKYLLEIE